MHDFHYHRPGTLVEAAKLVAEHEDGVLMAGGMTLIPTMKQRLAAPSDVIDLSGVGNSRIEVDAGTVTIGAGATHAEVAESADVRAAIPALAGLAGEIGDPHVRHRGTLGGSIVNNDPAADYPAALVGLNATVVTTQREIVAEDFFVDLFETALERDEIVSAVRFPVPKRAGYAKFPNPASRYAVVGVFVADFGDGVRVAVTGAGPVVFRHSAMESVLSAEFSGKAARAVALDAGDLNADIHASAEYRAHLISVMAARAVDAANG